MDKSTAHILLASLLERLRDDSLTEKPRFAGLVSEAEREALSFLAHELGLTINTTTSEPRPPNASPGEAKLVDVADVQAEETPKQHSQPVEPPEGAATAANPLEALLELDRKTTAAQVETQTPEGGVFTHRSPAPFTVCETAFTLSEPENPDLLLCLDFGTAKSKAFAASTDQDNPKLIELGLGTISNDAEAIYAVNSSVWIDDDGLMFAGPEAFRRGELRASGDPSRPRKRLDSIKQELSQALVGDDIASRLLPKEINPTDENLTYDDAITFYLAYLTDLAVSELQKKGKSRYVKRRFTIPCWEADQRVRAARLLSNSLACAQVLADTFQGRWKQGIHVREVKQAFQLVTPRANELRYLLDLHQASPENLSIRWGGLLEPLAAGSARIWAERSERQLMMVLDVGAGTSDFSLFFVDQNFVVKGRRAFPVVPCGRAIRQAGDTLDSLLVSELLDRAHLGADEGLRRRISSALWLSGVRRLKERLFVTGSLQQRLVNDQEVSMTLEEFLRTEGVSRFTGSLESCLQDFLNGVDKTWLKPLESVKLVLTGGGCDLPMVKSLKSKVWSFGGQEVRFRLVDPIPEYIANNFTSDFIKEYPQLSVALGGALPTVLDERSALSKWHGATPPPGPLPRFPVTGL